MRNDNCTIPIASEPPNPVFNTAEEAIRFVHPLLPKAKADALLLANTTIDDGFWTDQEFAIRFSNGLFLHVFVEDKGEGWTLLMTALKMIRSADRCAFFSGLPMVGLDHWPCRGQ